MVHDDGVPEYERDGYRDYSVENEAEEAPPPEDLAWVDDYSGAANLNAPRWCDLAPGEIDRLRRAGAQARQMRAAGRSEADILAAARVADSDHLRILENIASWVEAAAIDARADALSTLSRRAFLVLMREGLLTVDEVAGHPRPLHFGRDHPLEMAALRSLLARYGVMLLTDRQNLEMLRRTEELAPLGPHARKALDAAGVRTVMDLAQLTRAQFRAVPRCGDEEMLHRAESLLADHDLSFRRPPFQQPGGRGGHELLHAAG